jgi:hypothetical protein
LPPFWQAGSRFDHPSYQKDSFNVKSSLKRKKKNLLAY